MKNRVKAGLGLVGLGAISVGGVAAADPSLLGVKEKDSMPLWLALSKDHDFVNNGPKVEDIIKPEVVPQNVSNTYKGKFGETYKNYLVGVVGSTKSGNNVNKDFWEWSFERLKKETTVSNNFKYSEKEEESKVSKAISDANGKGLNQVCKKAYEANTTDVASNVGSEASKYEEGDVWKFCSPIGQKPTTIEQYGKDNYGRGTVGNEYKDKLISVSDPRNRWFWEIRDWEIRGNNRITRVGVNWTEGNYFYIQIRNKHIKDLCASAYSAPKDGNSGSRLTNDEVQKYCSLLSNEKGN